LNLFGRFHVGSKLLFIIICLGHHPIKHDFSKSRVDISHFFSAFGGPCVLSFCGLSQATGGNFKSWDNIIGQALNHLHNCANGIAMRGDENGLASLTKGSKVEAIPGKKL